MQSLTVEKAETKLLEKENKERKKDLIDEQFKQEETPVILKNKFRSIPKENFSKDSVKRMLKDNGFFNSVHNNYASGFSNDYELQNNGNVVYDRASGLIWQQSGSDEAMIYKEAKTYVKQLNRDRFAGYNDWRIPTFEEAMSLMEPIVNKDELYIVPVFDNKQYLIWTTDLDSASCSWVVNFNLGNCINHGLNVHYVRAVR